MFLRRVRSRADDRGVAMVVVTILVVLCATVSLVVASSAMFGTRQTADNRSRLQALAAAEGGRDSTVAALRSAIQADPSPCPADVPYPRSGEAGSARYEVAVTWSASATTAATFTSAPPCPWADGYIRIQSTGYASDGTSKTVLAAYRYTPRKETATTIDTTTSVPVVTTSTATAVTAGGLSGAIVQGEGGSLSADIKNQDI